MNIVGAIERENYEKMILFTFHVRKLQGLLYVCLQISENYIKVCLLQNYDLYLYLLCVFEIWFSVYSRKNVKIKDINEFYCS